MNSQRESFVFYRGFRDAINALPEEYRLKVLQYLMDYAFDGIEPEENSIEKAMFLSFKPQVDATQKRYEANVKNGQKGGRPKKENQETQNNPDTENENPSKTQNNPSKKNENPRKPNPNLNYNYNVNDNYNDNNVYCTELESSSSMPAEKAAITLTLNDKSEYPIFDKDIAAWKELYPNVDIVQELRKMKGWLNSNPTRRKTKKGILKFVNSWLAKEQDKGGYKNYGANTTYSTTSGGQYQESEPECFSDRWIREKREAAEARGETFVIEDIECDF